MSGVCKELSGIEVDNISSKEVCRKQMTKDLLREVVLLNGREYHCPQDMDLLRTDLLSKVVIVYSFVFPHLLSYLTRLLFLAGDLLQH